ncbi:phage protein Gp36 family protein [Hymenobacter terrenus]|uniref:phage protein Gp36 family protein n=1 Tax=Hymenobacter terrenus TaxID=1629124 RepID=UPI0006193595|nr:phage protein Gp36 family protein [Hymenobacter terrenus]
MYFLTQSDFDTVIASDQLAKLLSVQPAGVLDKAVASAVDEVVSYLTGRYDLEQAFATTGEDRNDILVLRTVDLALYHLYATISPRNIPDLRRDRYTEAVDLFRGASKGTRFLALPVKSVEGQSTYLLYGSNKRFQY